MGFLSFIFIVFLILYLISISTSSSSRHRTFNSPVLNARELPTWGGRSSFSYSGSVKKGTIIIYGSGYRTYVSATQYAKLLKHFQGCTVSIGTSRTTPPRDSVGEWLQLNVTRTAIASYVGPILIREGYAEKVGSSEISFLMDSNETSDEAVDDFDKATEHYNELGRGKFHGLSELREHLLDQIAEKLNTSRGESSEKLDQAKKRKSKEEGSR